MKCKIEILPAAWEDLKQIEDWYLVQFGVETALKVTDSILATVIPDAGCVAESKRISNDHL